MLKYLKIACRIKIDFHLNCRFEKKDEFNGKVSLSGNQ